MIDPLFQYGTRGMVECLDRVYRTQTQVFMPLEFPTYYESDAWLRARRVLDIGTGNGCYLRGLASQFPEKEFVGIDTSSEMLEIARREFGDAPNLRFELSDLFDYSADYNPFEFIIMRFVAQHLRDVSLALSHCASKLAGPSAALLIIDALDSRTVFFPKPQRLLRFYELLRHQRRSVSVDHDIVASFDKVIRMTTLWTVVASQDILVPSTIAGHLEKMVSMEQSILEFLEATQTLNFDFQAARLELQEWAFGRTAYVHEAIRVLRLERRRLGS